MHAGRDMFDSDWLVLPQPIGVPARMRRSAGPRVAPPRLTCVPVAHPTAPARLTIADLCIPADLVHTHTAALAEHTRAAGAEHSMRLWRDACHDAIISLARIATATPDSAACKALYWELAGDEYHVSATFASTTATRH